MTKFLLGDEWLDTYVHRLAAQGFTEEQITESANRWVDAVVKYVCWLQDEGHTVSECTARVNSAIDAADFDLLKLPVCAGD